MISIVAFSPFLTVSIGLSTRTFSAFTFVEIGAVVVDDDDAFALVLSLKKLKMVPVLAGATAG